jgi:hypothetical protein
MVKKLQKTIVFVPIPVWLMRMIIAVLQLLPKPPINKDNLTGLLVSKYIDTSQEQKMMPQQWLSLSESLAAMV